jgi:hypothetical protein
VCKQSVVPSDRRGFLQALLVSAGGAAVAALPGCSAPASPVAREWLGAVQAESVPTRVRPGLRYANTLPVRVPRVRQIASSTVTLRP